MLVPHRPKGKTSSSKGQAKRSLTRPTGTVEPIGELLLDYIEARGLRRPMQLAMARRLWPEICGPRAAQVSRPAMLQRDVLTVRVTDSVWLQELSMQKPTLLTRLAEAMLDDMAPTDLRFILAGSLEGDSGGA